MGPDDLSDRTRRPRGLEDAGPVPTVDELRRQQRREASHLGLGTEGQTKGAVLGWLFGAVVGAVLLLVVGLIVSDAVIVRVVLSGTGALFGGVAGAVYGGSRRPERTNETVDHQGHPETEPSDDLDPPRA